MNRSALFTAFNAARNMPGLDPARVNRGLGVAQTKRPACVEDYGSTPDNCGCPDRRIRRVVCKHMVGLALKQIGG
jgi:hypothetical protein